MIFVDEIAQHLIEMHGVESREVCGESVGIDVLLVDQESAQVLSIPRRFEDAVAGLGSNLLGEIPNEKRDALLFARARGEGRNQCEGGHEGVHP